MTLDLDFLIGCIAGVLCSLAFVWLTFPRKNEPIKHGYQPKVPPDGMEVTYDKLADLVRLPTIEESLVALEEIKKDFEDE